MLGVKKLGKWKGFEGEILNEAMGSDERSRNDLILPWLRIPHKSAFLIHPFTPQKISKISQSASQQFHSPYNHFLIFLFWSLIISIEFNLFGDPRSTQLTLTQKRISPQRKRRLLIFWLAEQWNLLTINYSNIQKILYFDY